MPSIREPLDPRVRVELVDKGDAAWILFRGEADIANLEHLAAGLAGLELDGQRDVQLHLDALEFVDVAALRQLTSFAVQLRQSGCQVTTLGANPVLESMAGLLGFRARLGLR